MKKLRDQIDAVDRQIVALLGKRLEIAREIARVKKREKLPILDAKREALIREELRSLAKEQGLSAPVVEEIFQLILDYSRLEMEMTQ